MGRMPHKSGFLKKDFLKEIQNSFLYLPLRTYTDAPDFCMLPSSRARRKSCPSKTGTGTCKTTESTYCGTGPVFPVQM
jgi:hypothetical protein